MSYDESVWPLVSVQSLFKCLFIVLHVFVVDG